MRGTLPRILVACGSTDRCERATLRRSGFGIIRGLTQLREYLRHRDQLQDADNDRHKRVYAYVFGPDADHAHRNRRRPVCKSPDTVRLDIRPASLQPGIDNIREDRDQIEWIKPSPFGQEIIIQTVGRSPIARKQKNSEEEEKNGVSDDEKIVRQRPAFQECEKPKLPPPEGYHPDKEVEQPDSMRPAQAQAGSMAGIPLNRRAHPDENVGDAKTDDDRRKHHHVLKLIVHSNASEAGKIGLTTQAQRPGAREA